MKEMRTIKKAIILYTAVTVLEQLLKTAKNKEIKNYLVPKDKGEHDSIHLLSKAASQYCKR